MLEGLAIAGACGFVAFLGIGSCWLMWRKAKDRREQIDIDKRMDILQMVKIPPEDSERKRQRIREAIREEVGDERAERICPEIHLDDWFMSDIGKTRNYVYRPDYVPEPEIEILQMPQEPPVDLAELNERCRRLYKAMSLAGISVAELDRRWRNRGRCSQDKT